MADKIEEDAQCKIHIDFTVEETCTLQRILQVRACDETHRFENVSEAVRLWDKVKEYQDEYFAAKAEEKTDGDDKTDDSEPA